MSNIDILKYTSKREDLHLRVAMGHFATANCHSNYYIDVVSQKSRLSEATAVAKDLCSHFYSNTIVDTILCLDGTEVIGACLADALTKSNIANMNMHKSIYVVSPEMINGNQMLFRDNTAFMISGKHVLLLAVSVSSGKTVSAAVDAVKYYGGTVTGIGAIFSTAKECCGMPVRSVFDPNDLKDYKNYPAHDCPMCKAGRKLDALVNSHGFSKL